MDEPVGAGDQGPAAPLGAGGQTPGPGEPGAEDGSTGVVLGAGESASAGGGGPDPVFWTYSDLFLFAGLALPAMLAGLGLVKGFLAIFRLRPVRALELLAEQFVGYLFLFLILLVIFRLQYRRPFWESLGWRPFRASPLWVAAAGWSTAFVVVGLGYLIRTPTTSNPLTELLRDKISMILIGVFGMTFGPLAEELAFRGFLQPLLARSLGAAPGILLTALPFGLLHFSEYGNSWRHVLLICAAGAAFGWMRQTTGSTRASTLMHAAYNALFFAALWAGREAR